MDGSFIRGNLLNGTWYDETYETEIISTHLGKKKRNQLCTCGHLREIHFHLKGFHKSCSGFCKCKEFEQTLSDIIDTLRKQND